LFSIEFLSITSCWSC